MLDRLADKWTVLVIGQLATGTMRFAELLRVIDGVSQKMLTSTLRDLERDGLVRGLCLWAENHIDEVIRARESFDNRNHRESAN
jgi:hypothetical protein